jgi:peptidyl-prolyl cis-trans isomerase D
MQIIQSIRDKGAAIVIIVIALSLIGFILMDAKQQGNQLSASGNENIGKVNGSAIGYEEFKRKTEFLELQEQQQSGTRPNASRSAQIREQVWNQITAEKIFYAEADKLGIDFTSKELESVIKSSDPSNPLMQQRELVDQQTGKLDITKVNQLLTNLKKSNDEQLDPVTAQLIGPQKISSISGKYFAMLNAGAYYPSWMEEKDQADKKNFANIIYVGIPYSVIADSTIKVTDAEIEKYVQSHKDLYKQDAGRTISYVSFSQLPDAADSARVKATVAGLKESFAAETNERNFLARNTSSIDFDSNYLPKSKIGSIAIDSIVKQTIGSVYGPYIDKNSYVLAKYMGAKTLPDSVKARHVLIGTVNPQTGEPIMEDSAAKKKADSIYNAIKGGADFTSMALQFSTDPGSKDKGGVYPSISYGQMVTEFNDFVFTKSPGSMDVVRTQFGYHVIEVMSQKGASPAYKIGFMAKEILASDATVEKASLEATKLAAQKDVKNFDAYIQKNGLRKITAATLIKENDAAIGRELEDARQLVRWVFEAKKGDISDPYIIGDQVVVATVDKVYKEGTQDVETARSLTEGLIRDQKKSEQIIKNLGANPTLEKAASAYSKEILTAGQDSSITFSSPIINNIGGEPKLIGAIFNKENLNKAAQPLAGKTMVYVFKVNGVAAKSPDNAIEAAQFKSQQLTALRNMGTGNWFEGLKKKSSIKDNRSKFY